MNFKYERRWRNSFLNENITLNSCMAMKLFLKKLFTKLFKKIKGN